MLTRGIRLVAGRNFTPDELAEKKPVMVINQGLAKRLWPNEDPIGQHLRSVPSKTGAPAVMLGIALLACLLPAWRALRVDPMVALRDE